MHSSDIAKCSEVRQARRRCGSSRVSCVRCGALDHGSEYPGRRWVETLRYGIYLAKGVFDGEEDRGEQQEPRLEAFDALVGGLGVNGTMVVVGASIDPIEVSPNQLIFGKKGIKGWAGGIPTDSQDTLRFAAMRGARPMIEKYPLPRAAEGYARMMSGKAEI